MDPKQTQLTVNIIDAEKECVDTQLSWELSDRRDVIPALQGCGDVQMEVTFVKFGDVLVAVDGNPRTYGGNE